MASQRDLKSYFSFRGRAGRSEYWKILAITLAVGWALSLMSVVPGGQLLAFPIGLAANVAQWAVIARRLHDLGQSGWWQVPATALGTAGALRIFTMGPSGIEAQPGLATAMMGAMMLYLVFVVTVGVVRGAPGPNRFGQPPG